MKIPQAQGQTVLNAPRAAAARVNGPEAGVYAGREPRALMAAADGLNRAGLALTALERQQQKLNSAAFEADAQQAYKEYAAALENDNDYEGYEAKYAAFEKNLEERGKKVLGENGYGLWRAGAGRTFFAGAALGTRQLAVARKAEKMRTGLADTLNNYAALAAQAATPAQMQAYRAKAAEVLQEAFAPADGSAAYVDEKERKALSDAFEKNAGAAYLTRQIEADPQGVWADLADPQKYKFLTPQERLGWEKAALKGVLENVKNDVWNALSQVRTPTGEVSLSAAEILLDAAGYNGQTRQEIMTYVSARMADEKRAAQQENRARDEAFYAAADALLTSGGSLTQGLKLAETYANDSRDKFTKEKFIQGLFGQKDAASAKSDPEEYLRLWKAVQDANVSEETIKQSFNDGKLNPADYRALVKDLYAADGEKSGRAMAIKQIEAMTAAKIADKKDRAVFMVEVKRQSEGKSPQEMVSIADDLLKKQGGFLGFGQPKYKVQAARNMEQQRVLGDFVRKYENGEKYAAAIVRGVRAAHPQEPLYAWSAQDVDEFVHTYGGEEKLFTPGTPQNKALSRIAQLNLPATPQYMDEAVEFYYAQSGGKSRRALEAAAALEKAVRKEAEKLRARRDMIERLRRIENGEERLENTAGKNYGY